MIGAVRVFDRDRAFFRRIWRSYAVGSFIQPLLYLLGVGIGVGSLVDEGPSGDLLGGMSYFAFYASALLASTVMFTSSQEALWPTLDGFLWSNAYRAMVATSLAPRDVVGGLVLNHAMKASFGAGGVAVVLAAFDETRSPGLVPAVAAAVLVALAFAMPLSAWTVSRTTDASFPAILRFGVIPMFLFGGVFYPVEQLPDALEPLARITPLWHGVELCRGLVIGGLGTGAAMFHVAVLAGFAGIGYLVCLRTFDRRLRS